MRDIPTSSADSSGEPVDITTIKKPFLQQTFGPWTTNDPKIQRTIVRTRASSGSIRKRFISTYPPAPTVAKGKTAITGGYEIKVNIVNGSTVAGYNVYSSTINNPVVANLIRHLPQPKVNYPFQNITVQDITSTNPFYWVSSVNGAGQESVRVPFSGNPSPQPAANQSLPTGGSSGSGASGGGGKIAIAGRPTL